MTVVELVGGAVVVPAFCQDEDVVAALAEGVGVDGAGPEVDVRVLAGGLTGRAAVEVPDGEGLYVPLLAVVARLEGLLQVCLSEETALWKHLGCRSLGGTRTRVLERVWPSESIQTYSAITMPRWSRLVYLLT